MEEGLGYHSSLASLVRFRFTLDLQEENHGTSWRITENHAFTFRTLGVPGLGRMYHGAGVSAGVLADEMGLGKTIQAVAVTFRGKG